MEQDIINLNIQIFSNNNTALLSIIEDLRQIMNDCNENLIIERLSDIIIKMNNIISENKKSTELIRADISKLQNQINKQFSELKISSISNQEIEYKDESRKKYIGQVLNGVPEGKGIMYWNNGCRYEGEWRNNKKDGKGIFYYANGDRYEGDFRNGKIEGRGIFIGKNGEKYIGDFKDNRKEGKGIEYYTDGGRYEGDIKNDKRDGKGIYYFANGNRDMGDFSNGNPIGKHARLTKFGKVEEVNY